jgi:hypothetical protein
LAVRTAAGRNGWNFDPDNPDKPRRGGLMNRKFVLLALLATVLTTA